MRRKLLALVSILAAASLLAFLGSRVDRRGLGEAISRMGWRGALSFCGVSATVLVSQSLGWHLLLRARGWPVRFRTTVASMFMGNAVAWIIPSMYLGGEPLRILHVGKRHKLPLTDVASTVALNKLAEFTGFLAALLVSMVVISLRFDLPPGLRTASWTATAVLTVGFLVVVMSLVTGKPKLEVLMRVFGKRGRTMETSLASMREQIHAMAREHPAALAGTFLFTGGPLALVLARPLVAFWFMGEGLSFPGLALVFVVTQIALAFHLTPGGLGIFESGAVMGFGLIGIGTPEALAFAAMQRFSDVVLVGLGVVLMAREGLAASLKAGTVPLDATSAEGAPKPPAA